MRPLDEPHSDDGYDSDYCLYCKDPVPSRDKIDNRLCFMCCPSWICRACALPTPSVVPPDRERTWVPGEWVCLDCVDDYNADYAAQYGAVVLSAMKARRRALCFRERD